MTKKYSEEMLEEIVLLFSNIKYLNSNVKIFQYQVFTITNVVISIVYKYNIHIRVRYYNKYVRSNPHLHV